MTTMQTRPPAAEEAKSGKPAKGEKKKSKKKLIIILVAVLVIAGGAYKFVLAPKPKPGPPKAGETVKMDPTIVNLADGHYLKVGVSIQLVEGKGTAETFDTSEAGDLVIDEFANRDRGTLTNTMRTKLKGELLTGMKKAYPDEVYKIFWNTFLID